VDVYFYKMTTDNGGAPCVQDRLWSLAICKPRIRRSAPKHSIVIGFAGNGIDRENGVVHVARVTKRLEDGEYYKDKIYRRRRDCIYRFKGQEWTPIKNVFHGPSDMKRDLGEKFGHTQVLISNDFRYFGGKPFPVSREDYPKLRKALAALTQGHRRFHSAAITEELRSLVDAIFRTTSKRAVGIPTHKSGGRCNIDDDEATCICSYEE